MKTSKILIAILSIIIGVILVVICPVIAFVEFGPDGVALIEGAVFGIIIIFISMIYLITIHE